ncbi:hypothetical protein [Polaromonas sp.]|uniref:hypothetical protein n=1 Tax=Polaromonas sp. TaxID=1869339 RepID=UPI003CBEF7FA
MNIAELIAIASVRSGKKKKELAEEMGHKGQTRLSRISSGEAAPEASEIVYLAQAAQLHPIETLAEIESERHPEFAKIWKAVVSKGTWLNT